MVFYYGTEGISSFGHYSMILKGFVGPSYQSQSLIQAGEQTMNLFPERAKVHGKSQASLYPCPGFTTQVTLGDSPGRGALSDNGRLFVVYGTTVYEISSSWVATALGTVVNDGLPAEMTTNGGGGNELFVVAGGKGYIYELDTDTWQGEQIDAVDFAGQLDGFLLGFDKDTSTLRISESLDGQTWDGTQVVQRTAAPDQWKAMLVLRGEIYLIGERTGEIFYNRGSSPFPFAQRRGSLFEVGIEAPRSIARLGQTLAWLGQSQQGAGTVYWLNGFTPVPISTPAVEWAIRGYRDSGGVSDAIGWSYEKEGHDFYVLEFPGAGTWVYDATIKEWHERGKWDSGANTFDVYRARHHAHAFNKTVVCDNNGAGLFTLSSTVYTDVGGDVLRRVRRTPHTSNENRRVFYDYFELEAQRGVGLVSGQGDDPKVMLRYSDDGGHTWSNTRTESLGKMGVYDQRIRWDRCGSGRDRVWELAATDPVPQRWLDAYIGARAA